MKTIELNISGMTCDACVGHVTKGLQSVSGVQNVSVDLASKTATVAGESFDVSQLVKAIEEEGYGASEDIGTSPSEKAAQTKAENIPLSSEGCSCCE
ncbi:MAG: heavy-metal-associated domain-containing protein [Armatimonadetes bacterium]|nr:heavy-metal-associated domain-containing protein [Armatimonadota bacterium]